MKDDTPQFDFELETPAAANAAPDSENPPSGFTPGAADAPRLARLLDANFLSYASYVICERAIPNLEDGLKPVQRRILFSLHEKDDGRFTKVANIVGHAMQYHPHGDASIGDALVTLVNRGHLIEGQGNFGNLFTGDPAAASRYIECRLFPMAREELFNDDLTSFIPSYDGRRREPVTLPARIPLLLMLGADGIAVGLSTRILPHNFTELLEAQIAILNRQPFKLLPDFPQGGLMDVSEYNKGNGRVRLRARIEKAGDDRLLIRDLPYGVTTETLIDSIEDAARKHKVPVKNINDFTSERVEIELLLAADTDPARAIQSLYAFTLCETSVSCQAVVIYRKRPMQMDVEAILQENTNRLLDILRRDLTLTRRKLEDARHARTLEQIFIEERIYRQLESCRQATELHPTILTALTPFRDRLTRDITREDVDRLLALKIRQISQYDSDRNRQELTKLATELEAVERHLKDLKNYAVRYLRNLLRAYGEAHPRKTKATSFESLPTRELSASQLVIKHDAKQGYLGSTVTGDDRLTCSSLDKLLLVWKDGQYRVITPPEKLFVGENLLYVGLADRERILTAVYIRKDCGFSHLKRFAIGGTILKKDYRCVPPESTLLLIADDDPADLYVEYAPAPNQRIRQQVFHLHKTAVQTPKSQGVQLTAKTIARLSTGKPSWWKPDQAGPRGVLA
jgi:topoisomerase-4 subunit A